MLACCVVSTLCIYILQINLDVLIIYANGIFIMIYLLCMLAGCRLLKGHYRALAVIGCLLCLLLLAMVGWKSLYALVMLAGLWLFYPAGRIRPLHRNPASKASLPDDAAHTAYPAYNVINPDGRRLYDQGGCAHHLYAGTHRQRSRPHQFLH